MNLNELNRYRREKDDKMRHGYEETPQEMREGESGRNAAGENVFDRNKANDDNMPNAKRKDPEAMPKTDEPKYTEGKNEYDEV